MTAIAIILAALSGWLILRAIEGKLADRSVIFRFLIDLDIFFCALVLGTRDMTISSRCGIALRKSDSERTWLELILLAPLGAGLNTISTNHCELAIVDDLAADQLSIDILTGKKPCLKPKP